MTQDALILRLSPPRVLGHRPHRPDVRIIRAEQMVYHQACVEHEGRVIERLERHQFHAAVVVDEETAAGEVSLGAAVLSAPQLEPVDAVVVLDVPAGEGVVLQDSDAVLSGAEAVEHAFIDL